MADADALARTIGRLYAAVETEVLAIIANRLGRGLDRPDWAREKLAEITAVRVQVDRIVGRLNRARAAADAVEGGARQGEADALADLRRLGLTATTGQLDTGGVTALADDLAEQLRPAHLSITRTTLDVFREVVARASVGTTVGALTRRDAAQRALWDFADRGVTSFTDRSGRRWDLASYAEMATRTATARAAIDSQTARLAASGRELVQVSDEPQECKLCEPYEGEVLSLSGGAGTRRVEHATRDGEYLDVHVVAGLDQARAAGLFHPNCRHALRTYLPGVTREPTGTADPEGRKARERLRALERRIRKWKQREAAALDDTARRRARDGIRAAQADLRAHVATSSAKRQPQREQITRAR